MKTVLQLLVDVYAGELRPVQALPLIRAAEARENGLRDEFAGRALQGALSAGDGRVIACIASLASESYQYADAMLKARSA